MTRAELLELLRTDQEVRDALFAHVTEIEKQRAMERHAKALEDHYVSPYRRVRESQGG